MNEFSLCSRIRRRIPGIQQIDRAAGIHIGTVVCEGRNSPPFVPLLLRFSYSLKLAVSRPCKRTAQHRPPVIVEAPEGRGVVPVFLQISSSLTSTKCDAMDQSNYQATSAGSAVAR